MTSPDTAPSPEFDIANDIVRHLDRQRTEQVTSALVELRAQLKKIYDNMSATKDIPTCQIGLGLAAIGLGEREEAVRYLTNAYRIASSLDFVRTNSLAGLTNIGEFSQSIGLAKDAMNKYPGDPQTMRQVTQSLHNAFQFDSAIESLDREIAMVPPDSEQRAVFQADRQILVDLSKSAERHKYSQAELTARAEHVVTILRSKQHNVYLVRLVGRSAKTATLELHIDASSEECAERNFEIACSLFEKFGDRTGVEVIPLALRTYPGMPRRTQQGVAQ